MTSTYTSPYTSHALARMAGCASPDGADSTGWASDMDNPLFDASKPPASPGAVFLRQVEDAARERWDEYVTEFAADVPGSGWDRPSLAEHMLEDEHPQEVAADAVPTDPAQVFAVFTDLGAWSVAAERSAHVGALTVTDVTRDAAAALLLIAERLVRALVEEWSA